MIELNEEQIELISKIVQSIKVGTAYYEKHILNNPGYVKDHKNFINDPGNYANAERLADGK
jgi:hypothetical protein